KNPPSITLDYKLISSGMEDKMLMENYKYLDENDTVKFVSGSILDLEKVKYIIDNYVKKAKAYISPVFGKIEPSEIVDFMIKNNMNNVRLQLQLHKFIWDPNKKGV
ncbi:MAG: 7-carboxy-7-deazaguanine synthase QueE, partial [Lachnospirales bacterium]